MTLDVALPLKEIKSKCFGWGKSQDVWNLVPNRTNKLKFVVQIPETYGRNFRSRNETR